MARRRVTPIIIRTKDPLVATKAFLKVYGAEPAEITKVMSKMDTAIRDTLRVSSLDKEVDHEVLERLAQRLMKLIILKRKEKVPKEFPKVVIELSETKKIEKTRPVREPLRPLKMEGPNMTARESTKKTKTVAKRGPYLKPEEKMVKRQRPATMSPTQISMEKTQEREISTALTKAKIKAGDIRLDIRKRLKLLGATPAEIDHIMENRKDVIKGSINSGLIRRGISGEKKEVVVDGIAHRLMKLIDINRKKKTK